MKSTKQQKQELLKVIKNLKVLLTKLETNISNEKTRKDLTDNIL